MECWNAGILGYRVKRIRIKQKHISEIDVDLLMAEWSRQQRKAFRSIIPPFHDEEIASPQQKDQGPVLLAANFTSYAAVPARPEGLDLPQK
jgi:hypothetical protein